jgi:hypothetical protein
VEVELLMGWRKHRGPRVGSAGSRERTTGSFDQWSEGWMQTSATLRPCAVVDRVCWFLHLLLEGQHRNADGRGGATGVTSRSHSYVRLGCGVSDGCRAG